MDQPHAVDLDEYLAQAGPCDDHLRRLFRVEEELVIFDIGACEGEDSIRYERLFPRAHIYAFEPLPANQVIIQENFRRYRTTRTELIPVALSDRPGNANFHISAGRPPALFGGENWNYGNKSSSLLPPAEPGPMHGWIEFPAQVEVRCETLDNFCAERQMNKIDFIHLDVQGAEGLVLAGGDSILPRVRAIWLEVSEQELYRGQKLRGEIERLMHGKGFWLATEDRREMEGDQLYVNLRTSAGLLWWLRARFRPLRRWLRMLPGQAAKPAPKAYGRDARLHNL